MTREECLGSAKNIVTGDRTALYGVPETNFSIIAKFWTDYMVGRGFDIRFTEEDVGIMMCLFKIARISTGQIVAIDNYVDLAGYAACACEAATWEKDNPTCCREILKEKGEQ